VTAPVRPRRPSLAWRISLLTAAVAVITAVLAGLLAVNLITRATGSSARATLVRLADAAEATANEGLSAQAAQARARRTLQALKVQSAAIDTSGRVTAGSALARAAVSPADIAALLAGHTISADRRVSGQRLLMEGRPTPAGGIVLVQRRADANAAGAKAIRRTVIALCIAVVVAIALGIVVAQRIARPLRRTAQAARALAHGRRDVTVHPEGPAEVADVGEAVNTLATALSYSEGRQRDFLLSVSHELRTPLTALTGYAESLSDGVIPPEQSAQVGQIMLGEAHRLNRLVADLLDLARLGAQEFRIDLAPVDLDALARDAAPAWTARCAAVGVSFHLDTPQQPVWCVTDASRVRQILDGLFDNALRVTPAGAPIVLAVRSEAAGPSAGAIRQAVAEVRDGGPGLTDADLAVAFERSVLYERYRGVRQVGTGLGLAIVHGLAARLGGTVEAGHASEGGARFTLRLPVG
jgi:signal transduction histidine kinase